MKKYISLAFRHKKRFHLFFLLSLCLFGCERQESIVNNIDEREANEIIVFLASHDIEAQKIKAEELAAAAARGPVNLWNISVTQEHAVEAMAILNANGLPRRKGVTLLELFAKEGLMTSDREETIRFQAGQEEEIKNIIRKIDGVIDADVQISFPVTQALLPGVEAPKIKAAVYVKHQGVFDDPNNHLESKIKRLVSGSVEGLDFEDVSVVADRSRFTDIQLEPEREKISPEERDKEYVSIWSVVMTKKSSIRFRMIFFFFIFLILLFGAAGGWLIYKFYPYLQKSKEAPSRKKETPIEK